MEPNTIRLQENTWAALDEEADEYGFRNRSEYIRHLIEHRDAIRENTSPNTERIRDRVDELEERLAALEAGTPAGRSDDTEPRAASAEHRESGGDPTSTSGVSQSDDGPERAESAQQAGSVDEASDTSADASEDSDDDTDGQGDGEAVLALQDVNFPARRDRDKCEAAILAVRDHLREQGPASMREIVTAVMPEHPIGYDVPELESGDRYRGSWWRKIVKPGLKALPDVEEPEHGASKWRYTGSE